MPKKTVKLESKTAIVQRLLKANSLRTNTDIAEEVECSPSLVFQQRVPTTKIVAVKSVERVKTKKAVRVKTLPAAKGNPTFSFDDLSTVHNCAIELSGCAKLLTVVAAYEKLSMTT